MFSKVISVFSACVVLAFSGCVKPYHEPVLVEFDSTEVPILIELGDDNSQEIVDREKYYKDRLVMSKRVEIPHEWKQTGRYNYTGKWIPSVKTIVVDTQPETTDWQGNRGIWVESSDSVGFSTGITLTAEIEEGDEVKFLSHYPPKSQRKIEVKNTTYTVAVTSLKQIMDVEIKGRIQGVYADLAGADTMDAQRSKKKELMDATRTAVTTYFKQRGITITNIGQFGGFSYENPAIQVSIDKVFQAQQDKEVAKAEAVAAEERKLALKLKGEGEAARILESRRGEAEGIKLVAEARKFEADLAKDPNYLTLYRLKIQKEQIESWNGQLPKMIMGEGKGMGFLMQMPEEVK